MISALSTTDKGTIAIATPQLLHPAPLRLVIIDASVSQYEMLAASVDQDAQVYILDPQQDGVEQITAIARTALSTHPYENSVEIHLVSHGSPGCLQLGNTQLSLDTFARYEQELRRWFNHANASLALYGCRVAAGDAGAQFIATLHQCTGVEISASSTLIGHAALHGNWVLDVTTGAIAPALPFNPVALSHYPSTLDPVNLGTLPALTGPVAAPSNNPTSWVFDNGSIGDGEITASAQTDAFDSALQHVVNGTLLTDADGIVERTVSATGSVTLTYDPLPVAAGGNATVQYTLDNNLPVARSIITLSNPTNAPITLDYYMDGNLGSDAETQITGSSNGDLLYTSIDQWVVSDDASTTTNDPAVVTVFYGPNATIPPGEFSSFSFGIYSALFNNVVVPANSTISFLFFTGISNTSAAAQTLAAVFNQNATVRNSLVDDLTPQQLLQIKNWDFSRLSTGTALPNISFTGGKRGIRLIGTRQANRLVGTKRNDVLNGRGGNDTLQGKGGNDLLKGGAARDTLNGAGGNDQLSGEGGNDVLIGGIGNDSLLGGDGIDTLSGNDGNDVLVGGQSADNLTGGTGRDTFRYNTLTEGNDAIADFNVAEDLIDLRPIFAQSQFAGATPFTQYAQFVRLEQTGSSTQVQVDADGSGSGTIFTPLATLQNVSVSSLTELNFVIA